MIGTNLLARLILAVPLAAIVPATTQQPTATKPAEKTIVKLVGRQNTVSILATPAGVRYSAVDAGGKQLFSAIALQDVKAAHPDIYKLIAPTVCAADQAPTIMADVDAVR